ncbi:cysteine synthase [Thermanaeromonas toyohensis ToBE]|uniref:Cysteine synthase n=1 Tax=Thermanaeromonas toyohensis ToBE TaxID=698762 RepID=A0A1W1VHF1_9FIRM|nr:PLP-dependent aspartate aminotransferase family protein [Thermanaeromonas toyohensis]SMB92374.1 cysteine synthase [Thermanaeromonas toyohensis ToBE]
MQLNTLLVQIGVGVDTTTGSISMPIYQTATFRHPALGQSTGFDYSRTNNPTRKVLEDGLAILEGGCRGLAFASGMAAITAILYLFRPGDHLLVCEDLYGGTYRLLNHVAVNYGLKFSLVDTTDLKAVKEAIQDNTKAIFLETPTNPLMKITDIAAIAALAKEHGLLTIVDNTFMTPYLQRPLELGADLVVHSATKYLGGHNDVVLGAVVSSREDLAERLAFIQNTVGAVPGPQDCWLVIRGLKTLAVRLDRAQANAFYLARWLASHPLVTKVYYPGLPDHPGHEVVLRQARGFGAMLSFEVARHELVEQILSRVKVISFAESLGGVESLITFPERQTHAEIPEELRRKIGINDRLLRLSVGLEDPSDLQADLEQALG